MGIRRHDYKLNKWKNKISPACVNINPPHSTTQEQGKGWYSVLFILLKDNPLFNKIGVGASRRRNVYIFISSFH